MQQHTLKDWIIATRPWSFPISSMPVIVTCAYLVWQARPLNWTEAFLALIGMVVFHAAGNVLSDLWDYRKGVDNEQAYAVPNLVFKHFAPNEYKWLSIFLFAVGIAIGVCLCLMAGWQLLIIGGVGFALAASYSFFKYRALGDVFVFTCFSVLPMIGTSFVTTGEIFPGTLWVAFPLGIITVAVLHNNNTVDIATDKASGIKTIPIALGERTSAALYIVYLMLPYLGVLLACIMGALPWLSLLCLLSAPVACKNCMTASRYFKEGRQALLGLDQKTAQLHMAFSLLLSLGLVAAHFLC